MTVENKATEREIRLLLAYRHRLLREGLTCLLDAAGFEVVAGVDREEDVIKSAVRHNPDILLLAWDLPKEPVEIVRRLVTEKNYPGTVALVGPPQSSDATLEPLLAGARGYLSINLGREEFIASLRFLARGDFVVSQDMGFGLGRQIEAVKAAAAGNGLSDRERQVLALVAMGATNKEIANELTVTENTVKVHLRHILDKLDLRNRQQAAAYAVREGMAESEEDQELKE